jgi:hypothetical protein
MRARATSFASTGLRGGIERREARKRNQPIKRGRLLYDANGRFAAHKTGPGRPSSSSAHAERTADSPRVKCHRRTEEVESFFKLEKDSEGHPAKRAFTIVVLPRGRI